MERSYCNSSNHNGISYYNGFSNSNSSSSNSCSKNTDTIMGIQDHVSKKS